MVWCVTVPLNESFNPRISPSLSKNFLAASGGKPGSLLKPTPFTVRVEVQEVILLLRQYLDTAAFAERTAVSFETLSCNPVDTEDLDLI